MPRLDEASDAVGSDRDAKFAGIRLGGDGNVHGREILSSARSNARARQRAATSRYASVATTRSIWRACRSACVTRMKKTSPRLNTLERQRHARATPCAAGASRSRSHPRANEPACRGGRASARPRRRAASPRVPSPSASAASWAARTSARAKPPTSVGFHSRAGRRGVRTRVAQERTDRRRVQLGGDAQVIEHVADAPAAVGRPAHQLLGVERASDPGAALAKRERSRVQESLEVVLEHGWARRVRCGAQSNAAAQQECPCGRRLAAVNFECLCP